MRQKFFLYVLTLLALGLNTACERNASPQARIALQLPAELQEKIQKNSASSFTALKLQHLALQVTGPDLKETILVIADATNGTSLPAEVAVEVAPGERLIQLLAAYGSDNSDSSHIYYGDITKTLRGGTELIELPIAKLGGTGASNMVQVKGRFLTSMNAGPTGELRMIYRPAGKPGMVVDRSRMTGGWFELSLFQDVPVDYVLDSGVVVGSQWTATSLTPQNHLIRISTPSSFEQQWQNPSMMTYTYFAREARTSYYGFFASNTAFLSDKKICVTSKTAKNGTIHNMSYLAAQDPNTALPYRHFETGQPVTISNSQITIAGGIKRASCEPLISADEYHKYLVFHAHDMIYGGIYGNEAEILGIGSTVAAPLGKADAFSGLQYRIRGGELNYSNTLGLHLDFTLLPGTEGSIDSVQIYRMPSSSSSTYHFENRCDRLVQQNWSLERTLKPVVVGSTLKLPVSDLNNITNDLFACISSGGKLVGETIYLGFMQNPLPANKVNLSAITPLPNTCQALPVSLSYEPSTPTTPPVYHQAYSIWNTPFTVTADAAVLYTQENCSGTPASTVNVVVRPGLNLGYVYIKTPPSTTVSASVTSAPAGVSTTSSGSTYTFPSISGTAEGIELQNDYYPLTNGNTPSSWLQLFTHGCFPFRVVGNGYGGGLAAVDGDVNISLIEYRNGYPLSKPAGFDFYADCASTTPLTVLNFTGQTSKSFAIKTGATLPKNAQIKLQGTSHSFLASVNIENQAQSFSLSGYPGAPGPLELTTYQCTPLTLSTRDQNNNLKAVTQKTYVSLNGSVADVHGLLFFSDNACSMPTSEVVFNAGTHTKNLFVYSTTLGSPSTNEIRAQSVQVTQMGILKYSSISSTLTVPLPASVPMASTFTVLITSGVAPYNIEITDPLGSYSSFSPTFNAAAGAFEIVHNSGYTAGLMNVKVTDAMGAIFNGTITVGP